MAKQNAKVKDLGPWDRFMLWAHENQKVIWVVLLIIIAPTFAMTGLFTGQLSGSSGADAVPYSQVFGETITQGDVRLTQELLEITSSILRPIVFGSSLFASAFGDTGGEALPGAFGAGTGRFAASPPDVVDFLSLREKARRMGIRISDSELGEVIRDIWQRAEAYTRAQNDVAARNPAGASDGSSFLEVRELAKKKLVELRGGNGKYFDPQSWAAMIEGTNSARKRASVRDVEETLRDLLAISRLESFVVGSVQVTPAEIVEEFNKQHQARKLSWVELKVPAPLKEKIAGALTPEEVKAYFEEHKEEFAKEATLRASWLAVPLEHFKTEAAKLVADGDLTTYYLENRNNFRKPAILSSEAEFALRSPEEKAAHEAKLFKPLEEVKDAVREKVIDERAVKELNSFVQTLTQRIYPPRIGDAAKTASDRPAVAFTDLVKEFPFLKTGTTAYTERDKAKDAFGEGYTKSVDTWFNSLAQRRTLTAPRTATLPSPDDKSRDRVFYTKPETRPAGMTPSLADIEAEVRDAIATKRILDEIARSAREVAGRVNAEGKGDLSGVTGVDITLAGETSRVEASPLQSSQVHVDSSGPLLVAKKEEEKKPEDKPAETPAAPDEPAEESHPAEAKILQALFDLNREDKLKVAVAAAAKPGAVYLVRFDDLKSPDPSTFEKRKEMIERQLRTEAQSLAWAKWLRELQKEARPQS